MPNSNEPWFGKKRFGWGVGPRTWQGWLICLAVVVGIAFIGRLLRRG